MTAKAKRKPAAELQYQPPRMFDAQPDCQEKPAPPPPSQPAKKSAQVIALLEVGDGATLADLCAATGWQAHTCRAFLAGLRKKGRILERSHWSDGASVYKLVAFEVAAQ